MEPIIVLEGVQLRAFLETLRNENRCFHKVSFAIDEAGLKVKINEGVWSPPLGKVLEQ